MVLAIAVTTGVVGSVAGFLGAIIVQCTLDLGTTMLTAASLGFVGLGAQPPQPDWGLMVAAGQYVLSCWWVPTFPGAAIFIR